MTITTLLAAIWGPILLAVGLGFFVSTKYYLSIYRDMEKQIFAVFFFGLFAMATGILHIFIHNVWGSVSEIVVSLLGWGLLVKGIICVAFPGLADRSGDWVLGIKLVPAAGALAFILGAYLSWIGYFA